MESTKKTRQFVKYANRKLHELGDQNPYVPMEEMLDIVASGTKVEVVDDMTGKNITSLILSRLIYNRCRMDCEAYTVAELQKLIMSNPPPAKKAA